MRAAARLLSAGRSLVKAGVSTPHRPGMKHERGSFQNGFCAVSPDFRFHHFPQTLRSIVERVFGKRLACARTGSDRARGARLVVVRRRGTVPIALDKDAGIGMPDLASGQVLVRFSADVGRWASDVDGALAWRRHGCPRSARAYQAQRALPEEGDLPLTARTRGGDVLLQSACKESPARHAATSRWCAHIRPRTQVQEKRAGNMHVQEKKNAASCFEKAVPCGFVGFRNDDANTRRATNGARTAASGSTSWVGALQAFGPSRSTDVCGSGRQRFSILFIPWLAAQKGKAHANGQTNHDPVGQ